MILDSKSLMENNQSYMLSSIFGSYLVHKNPTCFSRWSVRIASSYSCQFLKKKLSEHLKMGACGEWITIRGFRDLHMHNASGTALFFIIVDCVGK